MLSLAFENEFAVIQNVSMQPNVDFHFLLCFCLKSNVIIFHLKRDWGICSHTSFIWDVKSSPQTICYISSIPAPLIPS